MINKLKIRSAYWESMQRHVAEEAPFEACGLLAGKQDGVEAVLKVHNAVHSRVRFQMDPQEQFNALMWIEDNKLDLVGIYHSHPSGPDTVSATDINEAAYKAVHIIWSYFNDAWSALGFWIEGKKVAEVRLQIE